MRTAGGAGIRGLNLHSFFGFKPDTRFEGGLAIRDGA